MKAIYLACQAALAAKVPAIRWVDFDMGQLDQPTPPVSYPCVLIDFNSAQAVPTGENFSAEELTVEIAVAFQLRERTSSKTPTQYKDEALSHLDTLDLVRTSLEGLSGSYFAGMTYSSFTRDKRLDLRVYRLRFTCSNFPVAPDPQYVPWEGPGPDFCVHPDLVP